MENEDVQRVLLFLLRTARNHEERLFDDQCLTNAIVETIPQSAAASEKYMQKLSEAAHGNDGKGIPALGEFERLLDLVRQK